MTTPSKTRPLYRVLFAPITGQDDQGKDQCGPAREIGVVWPRKDKEGGIMRLDIIPANLERGVIFLPPATGKGDRS
jgi:hypothetical protein